MITRLTAVLSAAILLGLATQSAAQKRVSCGSDVLVTVTIEGSPTAPNTYALVSDGLGDYVNSARGNNRLTAILQVDNCYLDFTMNLNFTSRSMWALLRDAMTLPFTKRGNFFNFDRIASVPITTATGFLESQFCSNGWAPKNADGVVPKNADGTYRDNYGGCGTDAGGNNFVRRGGSVSLDGDERLAFATSPIDFHVFGCPNPANLQCQADYVRVSHPDANHWILRSENAGQAAYWLGSGSSYTFTSLQSVPFEIRITKP